MVPKLFSSIPQKINETSTQTIENGGSVILTTSHTPLKMYSWKLLDFLLIREILVLIGEKLT